MHRPFARLATSLAVAAAFLLPVSVCAQGIDLTVNNVGLAIGNKPRVTGIRLSYRDRGLQAVRGVNATIWMPYEPMSGTVDGLALGLPLTAAHRITGLAAGIFGVGAEDEIVGLGIGGLGLGSGSNLTGIMLGGLGIGTGGRIAGLAASVVGIGAGGSMRGLMIGGIGVGGGGDVKGIALGGIGVGGGGSVRGVSVGGIGVGVGGSMRGISIGGIGVGAGGDVTGLNIAGVGVGAGGRLKGISIAAVGVGAPRIEGFVLSAAAGAVNAKAVVVAPLYFRIEEGTLVGGSISSINYIKGSQRGLTIGLFNYARQLHGVQIGIINVLDGPRGRRVLPIFNAQFDP